MSVLQNAIAAASGSAGPAAYQVERSLRFNSADSAALAWTPSVAGSKTTWTWSGWVKRSKLADSNAPIVFGSMYGSVQNRADFTANDELEFMAYNGSSFVFNLKTTQVFRDVSAWYHLVLTVDSTNATASDRIRIYVNGSRVTTLATATYPSQNADCLWNGTNPHQIGSGNASSYLNGYITEVSFVDGQALTPSDFGETDSATGVWIPKAFAGTYGNNGFYLPFNDNSTVLNLGRNRQTLTADPYFPVTTLLLNGNQPSGVTDTNNNVFKDSSTNNFTITRPAGANVTQGTFSPFSQTGWSNYLNGSSYFNAGTSLFNYTTGNASTTTFTIEAFVYLNSYQTTANSYHNPCIIGKGDVYLNLGVNGSGNLVFYHYDGSARTITGSSVIPKNTWTYVAVRVTGGTATLYVGSSSDGSGTWYGIDSAGQNTSSLIGRASTNASSLYFDGYIASLRVSTTARTISVPTAAYSNDANTALLVCQSNRFFDQSSNAYSLTITGSPSVQAFSPFAPTAAYSAATNGGSGYFDGTGDYLTGPNASGGDFGSGDFTISFWYYPVSSANYGLVSYADTSGWNGWQIQQTGSNTIKFEFLSGSAGVSSITGGTVYANQWNYVVITRSGSTVTLYTNSTSSAGTSTNSSSYGVSGSRVIVGNERSVSPGTPFNGYLSSVKLVKQANTPSSIPTAPDTNTTNTSLLLNFTNGGITDATGKNVLETVGNAQISTTQSKWGGASISFDGTGDYLVGPSNAFYNFGTGDFTIECWIRLSTVNAAKMIVSSNYNSSTGGGGWAFIYRGDISSLSMSVNSNVTYTKSWSPSANTWYHVAVCRSGTNMRLFVDGTQIGTTSTSSDNVSGASTIVVGGNLGGGTNLTLDGYIDDLRITNYARYTGNFTVPAAQFAYNTADINVKQWVPTNFSVTAGSGNDSLVDSPTNYGTDTGAGGEVRGNYATLNPLDLGANITLSNGNLEATKTTTGWTSNRATLGVSSGKWYFEVTATGSFSGTTTFAMVGVANSAMALSNYIGVDANGWSYNFDGLKLNNGSSSYGSTYTGGDVIGVAIDLDAGKIWFRKNGTWQNSGDPAAGTNAAFTNVSGTVFPAIALGGQGASVNGKWNINTGQQAFAYTAPSGFKALNTQNLPTPAVGASASTLASKQFDAVLYTGNGSTSRSVTGVGFQPDWVWVKNRSAAASHILVDAVRGVNNVLISNTTSAEQNLPAYITALNSNGFSIGTAATDLNANTNTYVAWNWYAGGSNASNNSGSVTSTVRANTTAGISIVKFTTNSTTGTATIGHGLGVAPSLIIMKDMSYTYSWDVYVKAITNGQNGRLILNATDAYSTTYAPFGSVAPTSSVFTFNQGFYARSGDNIIAYCFAEVAGFSKFGSYTGNGSADGVFVYTGFRPRYVMIKRTDSTSNWSIYDTARDTYNDSSANLLWSNLGNAETALARDIDILSNGFKPRSTDTDSNASGGTYIFMAFAEAPFNYARAR
jgi:hypothetical protein